MYVKIDEEQALEMLVNRVETWSNDFDTIKLFETMYENYVYGGVFDGGEFDVMLIVDNDYVNYCTVIEPGDEYYEDINRLYQEYGCTDISCENNCYSFIEAEYNGKYLVRA